MNVGSFQCEVDGNESDMPCLTSAVSVRKYPPKNIETFSSQDHLDSERDETCEQHSDLMWHSTRTKPDNIN